MKEAFLTFITWLKGFLPKKSTGSSGDSSSPSLPTSPSLPSSGPSDQLDLSSLAYPWAKDGTCIVIDAYEKNGIDWDKMARDKKVVGVIHRSGIGLTTDTRYAEREKIARERGYLWGAYHLGQPGNVKAQADLFLKTVGNNPDTLMILDLEDTSSGKFMSIPESVEFMDYVYEKTGRVLIVYANHATVLALNGKVSGNSLFKNAKLWYARFKTQVSDFPVGIWNNYFLWQFSSEINCSKTGYCLYNVPGTSFDMDVNVFYGSMEELKAQWNNKATGSEKIEMGNAKTPLSATPWLDIARSEIGQKEISGSKHNTRILEYHDATKLNASDDETPWCAAFVSWCLEKAGIKSMNSAWARDYLAWGKVIDEPVLGCVVVFKRGTNSGHVAFFLKDNGETIRVLGGNQGNMVCEAEYKKKDLLGYRMPNE